MRGLCPIPEWDDSDFDDAYIGGSLISAATVYVPHSRKAAEPLNSRESSDYSAVVWSVPRDREAMATEVMAEGELERAAVAGCVSRAERERVIAEVTERAAAEREREKREREGVKKRQQTRRMSVWWNAFAAAWIRISHHYASASGVRREPLGHKFMEHPMGGFRLCEFVKWTRPDGSHFVEVIA